MLLNIYLGTTILSWTTSLINAYAFEKRLKREGYEFLKKEKSVAEWISNFMSNAFVLSFPVLNNILTIELLCCNEKMYENTKEKLLEKGDIYIPTDEVPELNMDTESATQSETYSQDAFIKNIQKDMEHIAKLKYSGYEKDLVKLYSHAVNYLNAKKQNKTTSPIDILSNEWFAPLIEIKAKLGEISEIQKDQNDIISALTEMRELLISENINYEKQDDTEDNGYQPTLRF